MLAQTRRAQRMALYSVCYAAARELRAPESVAASVEKEIVRQLRMPHTPPPPSQRTASGARVAASDAAPLRLLPATNAARAAQPAV